MSSATAAFCPKATSVTNPKQGTLAKEVLCQTTGILGKYGQFYSTQTLLMSVTEAASLKVSEKQGF